MNVLFNASAAVSERSLVIDQPDPAVLRDEVSSRLFKIRAADSAGHRSSANILVNRMYAWRGYQRASSPSRDVQQRITLVAIDHDETVGTLTVGFDDRNGLLVDDLFPDEVAGLRDAGHKVCEFTKLAMDSVVRSKRVLASLFHVAYIYAHRLNNFDYLLIEVNPRHVRFYERMLGFTVLASERMNQRVNAPAVLMGLDFAHARAEINRFGGTGAESVEKSLYPHFFSIQEEAGIVGRIRSPQPRGAQTHGPQMHGSLQLALMS